IMNVSDENDTLQELYSRDPELSAEQNSTANRPPLAGIEKRNSRHIWLISYADFMTILMIFFLAMYGYTYMAKQALMKNQPKFSDRDFSNQISDMKQKLGSQLKVQEDV